MEIERRLTNDELKNQNRLADRISEQMQVDMYMSFSSFITKKGRNIFVDFPHEVLRTEFLVWKIWIQHRNCRMQEVLINSMLTNPQQSPATYHLPPITYHLPSTTCHLLLTTYRLPPPIVIIVIKRGNLQPILILSFTYIFFNPSPFYHPCHRTKNYHHPPFDSSNTPSTSHNLTIKSVPTS
eukprot:TRINITY_DN3811_c0_g2_i12.p1 TRINITY_DN3811_c0_g2~~TRINITY_DN3811_c0_g2_i12.p1  ORF type:complete len:182 (+),score=23.10 TRINITY_DN3811_c0_g2_i12:713-1258(+)